MGHLLAIAFKRKKRGTMVELKSTRVTTVAGVAGDFRGRPGDRQVTVLAREGWQAVCEEIEETLPWLTRRANLYVEGVTLHASIGAVLHIGSLQLLITRETDPCERMTEAREGLLDAMVKEWRGGVCCRVIQDGDIYVGDRVEIMRAGKEGER